MRSGLQSGPIRRASTPGKGNTMLAFLTLTTADHEGRNVSVSYTDDPETPCQLLGNLPHGTKFKRSDLIAFARAILRVLDNPPHNKETNA